MAYYSGTATGPTDLLDKIRTALVAEGWTENDYSADETGYRLHVQKVAQSGGPTMYFNFRSAINEYNTDITEDNDSRENYGKITGICINGSTGYDAGESWDKQPGYSTNSEDNDYSWACVMSPMSVSAIPAYYIFFVGDSVHIVVEITSGKFQFMSFGCLEKQGAYTGGMYFTASMDSDQPYIGYYGPSNYYHPMYFSAYTYGNPAGAVYVDADSVASWRIATTNYEIAFPCVVGQTDNSSYSKTGICSMFWSKAPNFYNNLTAMAPLYIFVLRDDDNYSLLGWPEGVRFLNCTNYSAGQELTYGTDTWKIFHADSLEDDPDNMYCGFAFKKET